MRKNHNKSGEASVNPDGDRKVGWSIGRWKFPVAGKKTESNDQSDKVASESNSSGGTSLERDSGLDTSDIKFSKASLYDTESQRFSNSGIEELSEFESSSRSELMMLLSKLGEYTQAVEGHIAQAKSMLLSSIVPSGEGASSSEIGYTQNDIKKNIMTFYSLKFLLEIISARLSRDDVSPRVLSKEDMDDLVSQYGRNPDPNHFDNSLTRVYLIHLPRIIDRFLMVSTNGFNFPKKDLAERTLLSKDDSATTDTSIPPKQLEVESKIQFVINLLVLLNSVKVNHFYPRSETLDSYHYDFDPYEVKEFNGRPVEFRTDKVEGSSISQLDELWLKNNYSNIAQYVTYLLSDVLQVGNLYYQGRAVTVENLCTNPGYPFTLKALNLAAISNFRSRGVDLERIENEMENAKVEEIASSKVSAVAQNREIVLGDGALLSDPAPKNKVKVLSGFEMEIGVEDEGDLTSGQDAKYTSLKSDVRRALINKAAYEGRTISEDERDVILPKLAALTRSEQVLLHLILCNAEGSNVAFMEMPRQNMAAKIIGHLEKGDLKQSITDLIYAYEVNIDRPSALHETVRTAQRVEALLTDYYVPNFGIKIVQAPSFQLNLSIWVGGASGRWINTACPAVNYQGYPDGSRRIESIQYTDFYAKLLKGVNTELSKLITNEITGIFRCSKLVTHIDWKVYPLEERRGSILASNASSPYAKHRHDTGKSASIRVVGGSMDESRFEIRLFGPNVHSEAQMPNKDTINESLFKQSDLLAIVAEKVLVAVDRVNREYTYSATVLASACDGLNKSFGRERGLSDSSSVSASVRSGYTGITGASFIERDVSSHDEWVEKVTYKTDQDSVSSICRVM